MAKVIRIPNVPDDVHRRFQIRAAEQGLTVSGLLAHVARELAERPTLREMVQRLAAEPGRGPLRVSAAAIIRGHRGE